MSEHVDKEMTHLSCVLFHLKDQVQGGGVTKSSITLGHSLRPDAHHVFTDKFDHYQVQRGLMRIQNKKITLDAR